MAHVHALLYGPRTWAESSYRMAYVIQRDDFARAIERSQTVEINNTTMGFDPFPEEVKSAVVDYEYKGLHRIRRVDERNAIDFGWDILAWSYGRDGKTVCLGNGMDVTESTRWLFDKLDNRRDFTVSNELLRGIPDPAPGVEKRLWVLFAHRSQDGMSDIFLFGKKENSMANLLGDAQRVSNAGATKAQDLGNEGTIFDLWERIPGHGGIDKQVIEGMNEDFRKQLTEDPAKIKGIFDSICSVM